MNIELTEEQYCNLVKLVYLGNWLANSDKIEPTKEHDEVEQIIYSHAKETKLRDSFDNDEELGKIYPNRELEDQLLDKYVFAYNENTFWEELIDHLSSRDFYRKYGEKEILKMDLRKRIELEQPYIEKYEDEFEKRGLDKLIIEENKGN